MNNNWQNCYQEQGYFVIRQFLTQDELQRLSEITHAFHNKWLELHQQGFQQGAINSAYLTRKGSLDANQRATLFRFIASKKVFTALIPLFPQGMAFMNTQLFFNPANPKQSNYWHRDSQYHLSLEEQQRALTNGEVLHVRLPLADELGIELIPNTHRQWDSEEALNVRLERAGRKRSEPLSTGVSIALNAGDLIVFSANMIHRGLYGLNRHALDIVFCDPKPEFLRFSDPDCLPEHHLLGTLEHPEIFVK